jgi:aspartate racemase
MEQGMDVEGGREGVKTIGVIGGLGPQATMDFEQRVHRVSQRLIPHQANSGYPPMVVYYHRFPPFVVVDDGFTPALPLQVDSRFLDAARRFAGWADFIVITSNAPHFFQGEIERASGLKVLNMIDITVQEVQNRQLRTVGLVGMGEPRVYRDALDRLGIAHVTIEKELRDRLDKSIVALMAGTDGPQDQATAQEAVAALRVQGTDGIILCCTEIPLLLKEHAAGSDLINPIELLAEAAVRYAID